MLERKDVAVVNNVVVQVVITQLSSLEILEFQGNVVKVDVTMEEMQVGMSNSCYFLCFDFVISTMEYETREKKQV